ncbi:MAG TPA: tetratricopeptide repeat protein [Thermoanaerobaculia bacterium]|nr:tetratricopeptide repeat protein [Thermoanaerobaculia bacterium]
MEPSTTPRQRSYALLLTLLSLLPLGLSSAASARQQGADEPAQLEARAEELYAADRLEEAADLYLRLADRLEPPSEQARALVLAAWLQTLRGRPDLSTRTLEEALARDPGYQLDPRSFSESFQRSFEQVREARGAGSLPSGASLNEGLELLQQGDLIGARAVFEEASALDPSDEQIQFLLARIESRLGDIEAATSRLRALSDRLARGEQLTVTGAQIDAELGITAYRSGDARAAEEAFARAVSASPADMASWQNLGLARNQLGDPEGAAAAFRRALDLDGGQPELTRLLANTLLRLDREAEALTLLRELAASGSQDPRVFLDLGLAEHRAGTASAAADAFERAAALDPSNELEIGALALGQRAALVLDDGQPRAAAELAREALSMDSGNVDALNVLGLALIQAGETAEAASHLERARALAPQRADIANNLGKALFAAGRMEEATEAFEAALELDPSLQTARENLEVARGSSTVAPGPTSPAGDASPDVRRRSDEQQADAGRQESREQAPVVRLGATFRDVRHAGTGRDAVEVLTVEPGGLAERAGLRVGDLVLRVGGAGIGALGLEDAAAVVRRLSEIRPGEAIRLDLFRGQEALAVSIQR